MTKSRYPVPASIVKGQLPENWEVGLFCYPADPEWRAIVVGMFSFMGSGWAYKQGDYKTASMIGDQIGASLMLDCKSIFEKIADCLCLLATGTEIGVSSYGSLYDGDKCEFAKSLIGQAYWWVRKTKDIEPTVARYTTLLGPFEDLLPDGWQRDALGYFGKAIKFLFSDEGRTIAGVVIPSFTFYSQTEYQSLIDAIVNNQAALIEAVYESCTALEAVEAIQSAVSTMEIEAWQANYINALLDIDTLTDAFAGKLDKFAGVADLSEWTLYTCQGEPCLSDCVLENLVIQGEDVNGLLSGGVWTNGIVGRFNADGGGSPGIYQPYNIALRFANPTTVTIHATNDGSSIASVAIEDENCVSTVVREYLANGDMPYTTPPLNGILMSSIYPNYPYFVDLEVNTYV